MERDVDQPLHGEQALGAARELRADVDVQPCDVEPCRPRVAHGGDGVVGDEPELRLRVRGLDRPMRLRLDAGSDTDQNRCDAGRPRTGGFVERVEDDQRAGGRCGAELLVGLVVAVEDDPVAGHTCAQCELQLAACRDVGPEPFGGEQAQQRDVRKCLRPVDDERPGVHARTRARARTVSRQ